ncbi:hypothetical protein GN958_ATG20907 [Phytophthora infestans]|uniref:Uncharacterized protein n=1 Tax=Phytophthora infestans TaxID=4787 RepID=A0A8S9TTP1_PHYIN|nr:hypothetical protein GN958_ATG20907 [Phytophthora infestans]
MTKNHARTYPTTGYKWRLHTYQRKHKISLSVSYSFTLASSFKLSSSSTPSPVFNKHAMKPNKEPWRWLKNIRSTQIDPTAIEQHVNTQLQSAIAAANDVAQAQARATVEAHAVHQAHVADVRMTETIQRLQEQLYASMEQCVQDVLKAHVEQVSAEIRLTVAAQCREILKGVEEQINAIKKDTTTVMEQTKTAAEKKAKSIVRRHYAEENAAHEKIEAKLLQSFEDYKQTTVATALLRVDELLRAFVSQQTVKVIDVKSQVVAQHGSSAVRDKRSGGEDNAIDRATSSMPPAIVVASMSLDEEKEMHISYVHVGKLNGSNRAKLSEDAQELHKLMRYPKPTCEQDIKLSIDLQSVRRSEQQKVVARALARSRGLKTNTTKPSSLPKTSSRRLPLQTIARRANQEHRLSEKRKTMKKLRAEESLQLVEFLFDYASH